MPAGSHYRFLTFAVAMIVVSAALFALGFGGAKAAAVVVLIAIALAAPAAPLVLMRGRLHFVKPRVVTPEQMRAAFWHEASGRGLQGFAARSGESTGGGMYRRVRLEETEKVLTVDACTLGRAPFRSQYGYLTLTDRRLIWTGLRRLVSGLHLAPVEAIIPYRDIEGWHVERRFAGIGPFRALACILVTKSGWRYTIYPVAMGGEWLSQQLSELTRPKEPATPP